LTFNKTWVIFDIHVDGGLERTAALVRSSVGAIRWVLASGDATYLYNTGNGLVAEAVDEAVSSAPPLALPNKAATIVWI
jgi:hypothetical protein